MHVIVIDAFGKLSQSEFVSKVLPKPNSYYARSQQNAMLKRAGNSLAPHFRQLHSQASTSTQSVRKGFQTYPGVIISSSVLAAYILWYSNSKTYNDAASPIAIGKAKQQGPPLIAGGDVADSDVLRAVVWGSNR